jgi:molybdopterin-guanine dinucleotide biosynthesis protein A
MPLPTTENHAVSIAILCGGKSTRFGEECKILHKIRDKFMFQLIYERFQSSSPDIFLQLSQDIKELIEANRAGFKLEEYPFFLDLHDDQGPLSGIYSALTHAKNPHVFIVAADLPRVDASILNELKKYLEHQIIIPRWDNGFYEPLCAIYSQGLLEIIARQLQDNKLSIHQLYDMSDKISIKTVNIDELVENGVINGDCFRNVNTIKDL